MAGLGQAAVTIDGAKFAPNPVARLSYNIFLEDSGDQRRCTAHIWLELHLNLKPGAPIHLGNASIVFSSILDGTSVVVLDAIDLFVGQGNPDQGKGNRERSISRLYKSESLSVVSPPNSPPNIGPLNSRYATLRKETHDLQHSAEDSKKGDGEHIDPAYVEVSGSNVPSFNAYPARWASDKESFEFIKRVKTGENATNFDGADLKKPIGDARLVVWVCWKEEFNLSPTKDSFARKFYILADRLTPRYLVSNEVCPAPMELEVVVTLPPGCRDDTEYLKYSSKDTVAEWKESKEGTNEGIFLEWYKGYAGDSRRFITMNIQTVGDFGNIQGKRIKVLYYERKADLKRQAELTLSSIVFAITLGSPLAVSSNILSILSHYWPWSLLLVFPFLFLSLMDRYVRKMLQDRASQPSTISKFIQHWWIVSHVLLLFLILVAVSLMCPINNSFIDWFEERQVFAIVGMVSAYWLQVRLGFDTIEKLVHTGPLIEEKQAHTGPLDKSSIEHSGVPQRWSDAPKVRFIFTYHAFLVFVFIFLALKGTPTSSGSSNIVEVNSPGNAASAPMQR